MDRSQKHFRRCSALKLWTAFQCKSRIGEAFSVGNVILCGVDDAKDRGIPISPWKF